MLNAAVLTRAVNGEKYVMPDVSNAQQIQSVQHTVIIHFVSVADLFPPVGVSLRSQTQLSVCVCLSVLLCSNFRKRLTYKLHFWYATIHLQNI